MVVRVFVLSILASVVVAPVAASDLEAGLAAYERGEFITALSLLRPLAEQGEPRAQSRLGTMYMRGEAVTKNTEEGVRWYRKAASQGFVDAMVNLGTAYARGEGVTKDDV